MGRFHTVGKMRIPELRDGDIERTSLLARLQQDQKPLLILAAGSGFGKTALLTQYAYTVDTEVYWNDGRLSEPDAPGYTKDILMLLDMERSDANRLATRWSNSTSQLARLLLEHLSPTPSLLVLDSIEELSDDALNVIALLVHHLPAGYHIAVSLYELPNVFMPLIAADKAVVLNEKALAFTTEESQMLFEQHGSDANSQDAFEHFEGWPAALSIAAQGNYLPNNSGEMLIQHILTKLPDNVRGALPELSLYPYWSSNLAHFTDPELPPNWLQLVVRAGLPAEHLGVDRIRPHTLVKNVLTRELKLEPEKWRRHHQHLAEIHREQGSTIRLIQTLTQAGATDSALELIREYLPGWRDRTDWMLIRNILAPIGDNLPDDLRAIYAIALQETRAADEALAIFRTLLSKGSTDANVYFGLAIRSYRSNQFEEAIALAKQGEPYADERISLDLKRVQVLAFLNQSQRNTEGLTLQQDALELSKQCVAIAGTLGKASAMIFALHVLMTAYQALGLTNEAFAIAERAISIARAEGLMRKVIPVVSYLAGVAPVYGKLNADMLAMIEEVYNDSRVDYPFGVTHLGLPLATIYLARGDQKAGIDILHEAFEYASNFNPAMELDILLSLEEAYRMVNDFSQASQYLQKAHVLAHERALPKGIEACQRNMAYLHYDLNEFDKAVQIFEDVLDNSIALPGDIMLSHLYHLQCYIRLERDYSSIVNQFRQVIDKFEQPWNTYAKAVAKYALLDELPRLREAQRCLLDHGFPQEYFGADAANINQTTQHLQVQLFGFFKLSVNKTPVRVSPKQQEIIAYLTLNGPTNKSTLLAAVWPDKTSRQQHNNLIVQLTRLNKELQISAGSNGLFAYDRNTKMYRLAPNIELHSDLITFAEGEYGNTQAAKKAIALYQQGFLPNLDSLWLEDVRLELEGRFHHMVKRYVDEAGFDKAWPTLVAAFGTSDRQIVQALLTA